MGTWSFLLAYTKVTPLPSPDPPGCGDIFHQNLLLDVNRWSPAGCPYSATKEEAELWPPLTGGVATVGEGGLAAKLFGALWEQPGFAGLFYPGTTGELRTLKQTLCRYLTSWKECVILLTKARGRVLQELSAWIPLFSPRWNWILWGCNIHCKCFLMETRFFMLTFLLWYIWKDSVMHWNCCNAFWTVKFV